jgi:multidrug efflux pump subunit AcrA (membrane-fusion protein)
MQELTAHLKLRELAPAAATQTRTFRARFAVVDKSPAVRQALRLGVTASLHLSGGTGEPVAMLPAAALLRTNDRAMVWQVDDSGKHLIAKPVDVIRYTDEAVLVRGLSDGAKVVSAGIQKVDGGFEVTPVERSASGLNLAVSPVPAKASAPEGRS